MRAASAVVLLTCGATLAAAGGEGPVVDWHDAAACVGRVCAIRGTVAEVEVAGPTHRLYFSTGDRTVRIVLMRGWLVTWPDYDGRTIVATGTVDRFQDHVEMIVRDPSRVVVEDSTTELASPPATIASTPAPRPAAASPAEPSQTPEPLATATPTAPEVDQLRERVRELEERIRDLEGR